MQTFTKQDLEGKNLQRLLAIKKKLYRIHISDDYVWDCNCESCTEERERYLAAQAQIKLVKEVCKTRKNKEV